MKQFFTFTMWCLISLIGTAQFSSPVQLSQSMLNSKGFRLLDFEGDGDMDVITGNGDLHYLFSTSSQFSLYENDGDGNYTEHILPSIPASGFWSFGNFNSDDLIDFVYSAGSEDVYIKFNQGAYTFSAPVKIYDYTFSMGLNGQLQQLEAADIDGNGRDEVVVALYSDIYAEEPFEDETPSIYYINILSASSFTAPVKIHTHVPPGFELPASIISMRFAYFNNDAILDIFYVCDGGDLFFLAGIGSGIFSSSQEYFENWNSYDVADIDNNGALDVLSEVSGYAFSFIYPETGLDGHDEIELARSIQAIDIDNDGDLDGVGGIRSGEGNPLGEIALMENNGLSPFTYSSFSSGINAIITFCDAADADGDDDEDLFITAGGKLYVMFTDASAGVDPVAQFAASSTSFCQGTSVTFIDGSSGAPNSWTWSFPGGSPSSSTSQNPVITYNVAGTYNVTLTVSNAQGNDAEVKAAYITVTAASTFYRDQDGDGFGNSAISISACASPAGYVGNSTDCNDANALVKPGATEICNGIDDDCDGQVDEGVQTTYYRDADSDGYGNFAITVLACSAPAGYVLNHTDCNDGNAAVRPGAPELCNGINDDCDALTDEGCTVSPVNDAPAGAITIPVNPTTTTTITSGNLTAATSSSQALTTAVTGQDLWYKFIAPAPGIRLRVISTAVNLLVELQTMGGVLVDSENIKSTPGNEYLNFGNLVEGNQYRIAVRNYNSAQGTGLFTISANYLNDTQCGTIVNPYQYCNNFNAAPVSGANGYKFNFTSTTTSITYTKTQTGSTAVQLSSVPGLLPGASYTTSVNSIYNLTNSLGASESIVVASNSTCAITISPTAQNFLRITDACPNLKSILSSVQANVAVCGATDYQWEFTKVLPVPGAAVLVLRGSTAISFPLNLLPAVSGTTYNVRIRPKFANGVFGSWGSSVCMKTSGTAGMNLVENENEEPAMQRFEVAGTEMSVYPNPVLADNVNILLRTEERGFVSIRVFDITGKVVLTDGFYTEGNTRRSLVFAETVTGGIFIVEAIMNGKIYTERIIVQH